jgi:hypothetical protein
MELALPLQAEQMGSRGRAGAGEATCKAGGGKEAPGWHAKAAAVGKQDVARCSLNLELITNLLLRQISKLLSNFL